MTVDAKRPPSSEELRLWTDVFGLTTLPRLPVVVVIFDDWTIGGGLVGLNGEFGEF